MKKVWTRMICSVLLFACCILPSTAMAVEGKEANVIVTCLLYTSDAADEL